MPRSFPRIQDGEAIQPWHFNILYSEVERFRKMRGSGLIAIQNADGHLPPLITLGGITMGKIGKASGSIGARSGATYGTGLFRIQDDSGTGLTDGENIPYPCKNLLNKQIASGAYMKLDWVDESWWVVAVGDCANLS